MTPEEYEELRGFLKYVSENAGDWEEMAMANESSVDVEDYMNNLRKVAEDSLDLIRGR